VTAGKRDRHQPNELCAFCGHALALHTGNQATKSGCAATVCPQPAKAGIGRCALYTPPAQARANAAWEANTKRSVTITPMELADEIHLARFGHRGHGEFSSCFCLHEAMRLLGF